MDSNSNTQQTDLALRGIRVLDFTWIHAGPSATRILSDQGAEVIKVESNNALSVIGGPASATARGLGQRHNWNAGKLSISLNMKTPQGIDIAKRLVAVSDVVAENFSGRVMPSWGLDYDSIRPINPSVIMLSMSGFGRTGPWKDRVSYGQTLQAWSGFTQLTGFPDADPSGPASAYSDATGGMAGAQAVLLALIHRARTGRGQWLDVSQFESLSSLLETLVLDMSVNGSAAVSTRTGNRRAYGGGAPHGAYRCQGEDRWVAITVFTDVEWAALVDAMDNPHWTADPRFANVDSRERNAAASGLIHGIVDPATHCGRRDAFAAGSGRRRRRGANGRRSVAGSAIEGAGFLPPRPGPPGRIPHHRKRPLQDVPNPRAGRSRARRPSPRT